MTKEKYLKKKSKTKTMTAIEMLLKESLLTEKKEMQHRPDIDILRIALTLEVLVYHCIFPYVSTGFHVAHPESPTLPGSNVGLAFLIFMNYWHMMAFFFLAGISTYLSLDHRTEQQYRDERVHRLIAPTLFLLAFSNLLYIAAYWAPLSEGCISCHFKGNTSAVCQSWLWHGENDTLGTFVVRIFSNEDLYTPSPSQAWFCIYLFVYSQLLASLFLSWHPSHNKSHWLAQTISGCIKKPHKKLPKIFLGCEFKKTSEVLRISEPWATSPVKLLLYPGLILAISECTLRQVTHVKRKNLVSVFYDFAAAVPYTTVYISGYLVAVHDNAGAKKVIHRLRYWNLTIGVALLSGNIALMFVNSRVCDGSRNACKTCLEVLRGVFSGQGTWMLILGLYGVARSKLKTNYSWLPTLRRMAMPVYVTHVQILIPILSVAMWVPYLRSFPVILALTTLATCLVSYLIIKTGSFRYFFGLPPPKGSWLPGKALGGFLPIFILACIVLFETVLANVLRIAWEVNYLKKEEDTHLF